MKIAGLTEALNLFTGIPFTEWAWSEAPKDRYGVVTADGQSELKADADPAAEKMLTGYVDVFIKASDDDPRDDVENAMRAIGVWFRMESIQFEPETGFLHFEWRWVDSMNTARFSILRGLPLLLHVATATWDSDQMLYVTFEETAKEIFDAIGERDIGFYVPVDVEEPGGVHVTRNIFMRIDSWSDLSRTRSTEESKHARFVSFDDGDHKYLMLDANVPESESECVASGMFLDTEYKTIVFVTYGIITDPKFTYNEMNDAFLNRTPVYLYAAGGNKSVRVLSYVGTYEYNGETYYRVCFTGGEEGDVEEYYATDRSAILQEV